ncbi:MAG: hypothetical protein ACI8QS_002205 [Planctomycetota bacterium]|jgi:hypothetical protein
MNVTHLRRLFATGALMATLASGAQAQDDPFNTSLLSTWTDSAGGFADIWGEGDFAFQARYFKNSVDILDVSNPANITHASKVVIPGSNAESSAQDVKSGDGLLFIALEYDTPDGVAIVDIRDPYNPSILTYVDPEPGSFEEIHNLFYDSGWLYLCNSSTAEVAIVDLRSFDPDNAPANISDHAYRLTGLGGQFVHDITVKNGRLYVAGWEEMFIYDVSNLGSQSPQLIGQTYGGACHSVWPTDDGAYVITGDERKGGSVRLYEVVALGGGSIQLLQRDSVTMDISEAWTAHNQVVVGDRVYCSWYQAGAVVLEINRETHTFERVGQYDTDGSTPFGFGGSWGVSPLLGEDRVLISDLGKGTFVVDMSALQVAVPEFPLTVSPTADFVFDVEITGTGNAVADTNDVQVYYSIDGSEYISSPALHMGGTTYQVTLPATGCLGEIEFYIAATDTQGRTIYDPALGEEDARRLYSTDAVTEVFSDDFEGSKGWTITGDAATGMFVRVDPVGTSGQPEDDAPDGIGTRCFVTGQGTPGADAWDDDVDGGYTSITSPVFDMSVGDGLVRYSYSFYNGKADNDAFVAEISNDGGSSWSTMANIVLGGGGWRKAAHRVSDYTQPTANMRVRFTVDDDESQRTTTEGAVDEFYVEVFNCNTSASVTARNGSGLNPTCLSSTNLPILGSTWAASVDEDGLPGATLTYLISYAGQLSGVFIGPGELLIDPGSTFFFSTTAAPDASGAAVHTVAWPNDPGLVGAVTSVQGLLVGAGLQLCNALDLTLDN